WGASSTEREPRQDCSSFAASCPFPMSARGDSSRQVHDARKHGLFAVIPQPESHDAGEEPPDANELRAASGHALDAEVDDLQQRRLVRRLLQRRQRIAGDLAEMAGTVDGVADRAVAVHQCKGLLQLGIAVAALFDRRRPEGTLLGRAAPIAEYDGQGHLALAEVIAD